MIALAPSARVKERQMSVRTILLVVLILLLVGAFPDLRIFEVKSILRWFAEEA